MPTAALPRPTEKIAIVSFLLVFLCGGVAGAMVMSYWVHPLLHNPGTMSVSVKEWKQLDLTDEQTRQLTSILDDFSRYYDNLLADGNSRILQILNPDQRKKYDRMIREHRQGASLTNP